MLLVCYALPNGNTIEETAGKKLRPGDDWHFDIQHIGAQTRWLRQAVTNKTIVVAYLQAENHSWPLWRKQNSDRRIVEMVDGLRGIFSSNKTEVVLASHSGGGSLCFGYLNAVGQIPAEVRRIALLDKVITGTIQNSTDLQNQGMAAAASDENYLTAWWRIRIIWRC